jgi:methylated-DNA-protein-cysteine methyltransferase-like protein
MTSDDGVITLDRFGRSRRRSQASKMAGSKSKAHSKRKSTATGGPFERVWRIVKRVPRGRVVTYGQLARIIEHRLSPVGVGWAVRAAPEGTIPWHRVVNSRGGISTEREHPGLQRAMLEAEGIRFDAEGQLDLARVGWKATGRRETLDAKRRRARVARRRSPY